MKALSDREVVRELSQYNLTGWPLIPNGGSVTIKFKFGPKTLVKIWYKVRNEKEFNRKLLAWLQTKRGPEAIMTVHLQESQRQLLREALGLLHSVSLGDGESEEKIVAIKKLRKQLRWD